MRLRAAAVVLPQHPPPPPATLPCAGASVAEPSAAGSCALGPQTTSRAALGEAPGASRYIRVVASLFARSAANLIILSLS